MLVMKEPILCVKWLLKKESVIILINGIANVIICLLLIVWFYILGNCALMFANIQFYLSFNYCASIVLSLIMLKTAYMFIFKLNLNKGEKNGNI